MKFLNAQRIVYLHPHFTAEGGAGRMVLETGRRLVARGHEVHCICIRADRTIIGASRGEITFHEIGGPLSSQIRFWLSFHKSCRQVNRLIQKLVDKAPDRQTVLFPQVFPANWWASSVLKTHPRMPCVWYCQEPSAFIHSRSWISALPFPKNWIAFSLRPALRKLDVQKCENFSIVLANSEYSRECIQRVYGYSKRICHTVYLGVDHQRFTPTNQRDFKTNIVVICKLTRFKNVDKVIRAVGILVSEGWNDLHCSIVGTGDALLELQTLAQRLKVHSHITFHGRVDDSESVNLLQKASLFCLASENEPFGLVVIEAMACGAPVVAMNSGGPKEIISDHDCGYLVENNAPETLAEALRRLLSAPSTLQRMSQKAVERASSFHWDRTTQKLESILQSASSDFAGNI